MDAKPDPFNPSDWSQLALKWMFEHLGILGAITLGLVGLAVLAWWNWDKIKALPGVGSVLSWRRLPKASPGHFTVLVAELQNDPKGDHRTNLMAALREKIVGIAVAPLGRCLGGMGSGSHESIDESRVKARRFLRETGAQVLLWGSYHEGKEKGVCLRMEVTEEDGDGRAEHYVYQDIFLQDTLYDDLLGVLAMTVAARQAVFDNMSGHFIADSLKPHTDKVRKLLESSRLSPDAKADVQETLASALLTLGEQSGDSNALREAIGLYKWLLQDMPPTGDAQHRARRQNNLGIALLRLGERESGTERLEEAVKVYRAALTERTRKNDPLAWAMTQNNLGTVLQTLGQREAGTERLEEAVQAYRAALIERTREKVPLAWATTQNNLGCALSILGERESGTERLAEAVLAYRAALTEYTREKVPLDWAMTQNNLGNALLTLGQRESGTERLEEAVQAYRAALTERTREKVPLDWAATQNNMGSALQTLGQRESGTERLLEAVQACRSALTERTHEKVPLDWAMTQNNLGNALSILGEKTGSAGNIFQALEGHLNAWIMFSGTKHYYAKGTFTGIRIDLRVLAALSPPGPVIPQEYREKLTAVHAWAQANNLEFSEYKP
ncbi:MAG: Tetratricopeptide domain [Desulfovibrionaceae bacterium]|nr:MAG: Tetratricopeptide domain [Desulfovibrionaceae bacterium]